MLGFSSVLTTILQLLSCALAVDITLMENFEPEKIDGTWRVWRRTGRLIDTEGQCLRTTIIHQNGDIYMVDEEWMDDHGNRHADSFFVVDDRSNKARFLFQSDNHSVAFSILGTDYKNYIVGYGMLGPKESYYVCVRQLPPDSLVVSEVEDILKKNHVALDTLIEMDQSNC